MFTKSTEHFGLKPNKRPLQNLFANCFYLNAATLINGADMLFLHLRIYLFVNEVKTIAMVTAIV